MSALGRTAQQILDAPKEEPKLPKPPAGFRRASPMLDALVDTLAQLPERGVHVVQPAILPIRIHDALKRRRHLLGDRRFRTFVEEGGTFIVRVR